SGPHFSKELKSGVPYNLEGNRRNRSEYLDSRIRFRFLLLVHPFGACDRHGRVGWSERVDRVANSRSRTGSAFGSASEVLPLYMGWVLDTGGIWNLSLDWLPDEGSDESAFLPQADTNWTRHGIDADAAQSCLCRLQLK